ncbi:MAG: YHS domain-containing (seleno)protein [Geobacteraceae bacterium]|nr:YHS domain-containing (seleno)protein [Geobacteraceae bacterium]
MTRSVEVNTDVTGMVIRGYDPVAFFTQGRAVPGSPEFSTEYGGGTYLFATAVNRDTFRADPERYAPRYGGFCAYGVAVGKKFDIDAGSWRIKDDKLYFNLNPQILETWSKDVDGYISKSEDNWPLIRSKDASEL